MKENTNKKEEVFLLDLQLISSSIFIIASIVSLLITYNEKLTVTNRKKLFTNKEALNISFYNWMLLRLPDPVVLPHLRPVHRL